MSVNGITSSTSRYTISRCNQSDALAFTTLAYDAFSDNLPAQELIIGCSSRDDLPRAAKRYAEEMVSDPADIWIKLVDNSSGKIVSCCQWKLYLGKAEDRKSEAMRPPPWLEGEKKEISQNLVDGMNRVRMDSNKNEPYLYLHFCGTAKEYQRQGLGTRMIQWGTGLADLLNISSFVEGSIEGQALYQKTGYVKEEEVVHGGEVVGFTMRRRPRGSIAV